MPSSRQARMTRTAISPRFATSTRRKSGAGLEGDVAMLLRRVLLALVLQDLERADDFRSRLFRLDDLVDVAELRSLERVRERAPVVGDEALALLVGILRALELVAEDDVDGALRTHDRYLGGGEREVDVAAEVLGRHDVVGAAVRLAGDDRDLRDGRLDEGIEELRAVLDDAAELLRRPGEEAGYVDEGDDRDVEAVAEADEASPLDRGVDVEAPGEHRRLVRDDADGAASETRESGDQIAPVAGLRLEEVAVVD